MHTGDLKRSLFCRIWAESSLSSLGICANPLPAYLPALLFSLTPATPSLRTNTFRKNFRPSSKPLLSKAQTTQNSRRG